jgi:hypothetical protein
MTTNYYSIAPARIRALALPHIQDELKKQGMVFLRAEVSESGGMTIFYATRKNLSRIEDYPEKSETKFPIVELTRTYPISNLVQLPQVSEILVAELESLGLKLPYPNSNFYTYRRAEGAGTTADLELQVAPIPVVASETE